MIVGINTFLQGVCPKINVMTRLEFELAYFQHFRHYGDSTLKKKKKECWKDLNSPVVYTHGCPRKHQRFKILLANALRRAELGQPVVAVSNST